MPDRHQTDQPLFTFFDLTESLWLKLGGSPGFLFRYGSKDVSSDKPEVTR